LLGIEILKIHRLIINLNLGIKNLFLFLGGVEICRIIPPKNIIKIHSSLRLRFRIFLLGLRITLTLLRGYILNICEFRVEWELFSSSSASVIIILIFDYISTLFGGLVSLISGRVLLFRCSYIRHEKYFSRFIGLVLAFVFSIFLLIFSPNLIRLLLGWDGLGVTSYLLVIFYQRNKSYNAGIITALTNRLGDVGLLICLGIIISMGSWSFVYYTFNSWETSSIFSFILVLSACTKSAQLPFSAWLPAAMAAPTPVSALVHSSTLVTAGVYLLIRFNYLVISNIDIKFLILIGALTILMAGLCAIFEIDIKKVIALSTLSQLGVMIIILGRGFPSLAFFHLLSHAYFKAILFICAGILIHRIKDYQDIRTMGHRKTSMPVTFAILMAANISLCGLPFLRGFYSKDLILEIIFSSGLGVVLFIIVLIGTFLTVAYSIRLSFLVGLNLVNSENMFLMDDRDRYMLGGILILFPFALIGGIFISWSLFSYRPYILLPLWLKSSINLLITSAIITIRHIFYLRDKPKSGSTKYFLANIWFIPTLFRSSLNLFGISWGKIRYLRNDNSWNEFIFYNYLLKFLIKITSLFDYLTNTYFLNSFTLFVLIGLLVII